MDQQENVVFLNHSMLSKELYRLPKNSFAISYENQFGKVLVFDNSTGEVFGYDYELKKGDILFPSVASLLDALYA